MAEGAYRYVIVGGGLAAASAVKGIREQDNDGSILMIGNEGHFPYNRPPLTKGLWFGKKTVGEIFVEGQDYYIKNGVDTILTTTVGQIFPDSHQVADTDGNLYGYEKLLLATGGTPRRLNIPGADLDGICYYRYLDDYLATHDRAVRGASAVVIGGGFIGSEIAAGLTHVGVKVTMVFPDPFLVRRVFPESLGRSLQAMYRERGIAIYANDSPASFEKNNNRFVTRTKNGLAFESDIVIVGIGITPNTQLAEAAGLTIENGISVNEFTQTSHPDIFAAGDNAFFPYRTLNQHMRIEHWDHALNHGLYAGRNMAGAQQTYDYMPYFFSDLFEFGYEAVGDVNTKLDTFADWQQDNNTGVIYYQRDGVVRGVMLCNVWGKVDDARNIIRRGAAMTQEQLRGAITPEQKAA